MRQTYEQFEAHLKKKDGKRREKVVRLSNRRKERN
jgi:hypothetical protein